MDLPTFHSRTVHYQCWGYRDENIKLPTVYSLLKLHGRAVASPSRRIHYVHFGTFKSLFGTVQENISTTLLPHTLINTLPVYNCRSIFFVFIFTDQHILKG